MFKVTNRNSFDFSAAFNGQPYAFPAGRTVACDDGAVAHIFGINDRDKTPVFLRHGWARLSNGYGEAEKILANFVFEGIDPAVSVPYANEVAVNGYGPGPVGGDAGGATSADDDAKLPAVEAGAATVDDLIAAAKPKRA